MTSSEWKAKLTEHTEKIKTAYVELYAHIDTAEQIEDTVDGDELLAFIVIKSNRMNKEIEAIK